MSKRKDGQDKSSPDSVDEAKAERDGAGTVKSRIEIRPSLDESIVIYKNAHSQCPRPRHSPL